MYARSFLYRSRDRQRRSAFSDCQVSRSRVFRDLRAKILMRKARADAYGFNSDIPLLFSLSLVSVSTVPRRIVRKIYVSQLNVHFFLSKQDKSVKTKMSFPLNISVVFDFFLSIWLLCEEMKVVVYFYYYLKVIFELNYFCFAVVCRILMVQTDAT